MAAGFSDRAPAEILSHERLRQALAVRDWLLGEAREIRDPNVILEGLSLKLRDAGVPVDRSISAIELRHAERAANARIWEWGSPAREHVFEHARGSESTAGGRWRRRTGSISGSSPGSPSLPTTPTTSSRQ